MTDEEMQEIFNHHRVDVSPRSAERFQSIFDEAERGAVGLQTGRLVLVGAVISAVVVGSISLLRQENGRVDVSMTETTVAVSSTTDGVVPLNEIHVPSGLWVSEALPLIAQQIEGVTEADLHTVLDEGLIMPAYQQGGSLNWEGMLLPGNYELNQDASAQEVLTAMSHRFSSVTEELGYNDAQARVGLSPYETLIVASVVEAEAKTDRDRAKIASVIYNRLARNEPVGIHAPLIFEQGDRDLEMSRELLETDTPYNLRTRTGLPPTPIEAAGLKSLEAALNPAEGDWLFYVVADEEGNYFFTESYEEFLAQKARSEEQGLI